MNSIALIINSLGKGGAERVVSSLCKYICNNTNFKINLILLEKKELAYSLPDKITIKYLPFANYCSQKTKFLFIPFQAIFLKNILKRNQIAVSVSFLERANIVHSLAKKFGVEGKVIISERNLTGEKLPRGKIEKYIAIKVLRYFYSIPSAIIAISNDIRVELEEILKNKRQNIIVVNNPQDIQLIRKQSLEESNYLENLIDVSELKIVTMGRLVEQKKQHIILEALHKLIYQKKLRARLVMIGDGPLKPNLQQIALKLAISDYITWVGWLQNPFSVLKKCHVFVLSSKYEGFGNVIVEAMACGLPVVVNDCPGGPKEIIGDNEYGYLFPVGDVDALVHIVSHLYSNEESRINFAEKAKIRANSFDIQTIGKKYLDIMFS